MKPGLKEKVKKQPSTEVLLPWRIEEKQFPEGTKYLLQVLRQDASKPYYLTQRIYLFRSKAKMAFRQALNTGKPDDKWQG